MTTDKERWRDRDWETARDGDEENKDRKVDQKKKKITALERNLKRSKFFKKKGKRGV